MPDLRVRTRTGRDTGLSDTTLASLQGTFRGRIVLPTSPEYDEARTIWNAMIDRRPGLIFQCSDAADVVRAVRFARENDLLVAVRGGGHNIAGSAVTEGGLVIDLSPMKSIQVDPAARTARVQAGATLADIDRATQQYGLATPLGINSTTGVAGLTLGGGFGWLSRRLGLTIDNLLSAEVVTAAGEAVTASDKENADLFWAIRGGGGNFGVVTSFTFRLHEIGPDVFSGLIVHPLEAAGDVLRFYRDFASHAPEELACWFVLRKAPPLPFLPEEWHGREILALAVCYAGSVADGERAVKPLREFGKPIADVTGPHPYAGWQTALDPLLTPGMRNYWKTNNFRQVSDGLIDRLVAYARRLPDPQSEIICAQLGGAISRVPAGATAYMDRDAQFLVNVHARWAEPAQDAECIGWARELSQALTPFATGGAYVNFLTEEERERVRAAYGGDAGNYGRLVALKSKYDPTNLFSINQNIRPRGGG
jgi:FAD/FMN-containing dehydrogenase